MNKDIRFAFQTNRLEVYKSDDGKPHIRAVASDSLEDRQGDVITETCIKQMADQVSHGDIPLLPDHRASFEIGKSHYGDTRRNDSTHGLELVVDFELDDRFTEATVLFNEVSSGKCKRQLSIGGYLNKNNPRAAFMDERDGKLVMFLDDIQLDHIAVTREGKAANPRTNFVDAVVKAIDEAGYDVSKEGLVARPVGSKETVKNSDGLSAINIPAAIRKLDSTQQDLWTAVWKDTFIRQMHIKSQTVEQAEAAAAGVANAVLAKKTGITFDAGVVEYNGTRKEVETFVIGSTSRKNGHTHLWVGREVGEKIITGMMLTMKGHSHSIIETEKCGRDSDHYHTLIRKDRKVAEPSTELSAPVGLLYFGKGYDSEEAVRVWLDANGIDPLNIARVANSTFTVEFNISPLAENAETPRSEEGAEMAKTNAPAAPVEKATVIYKAYPLSDERGWSWSAADGNEVLGHEKEQWDRFKSAHTYFDRERGMTPTVKAAYSLPHHKLSNGELKTFMGGVVAATAILNGARGGFRRDTSEEGRKSLYAHLQKHYKQAGRPAPALKSKWLERFKDDYVHPNPKTLAERDFEDFLFSLELNGGGVPEFLTKEWWLTWDEDATGLTTIPETEKGTWVSIEKEEVESADVETETPTTEASEQEAADEAVKDDEVGTGDNQSTESSPEAVSKEEDDSAMKVDDKRIDDEKVDEAKTVEETPEITTVAELAAIMTKALAGITSAVSDLGKRVEGLEKNDSGAVTVDEAVSEEKTIEEVVSEEKSEVVDGAKIEEKTEVTEATEIDEKSAEDAPIEEAISEKAPTQSPAQILGAFHELLAGLGMTAKELFGDMAQKSLDSMGPTLIGTVEKTVKESISALQKGVKAEVEKSISGKLDEKLMEVAKDFRGTVEKLDGRLMKVEQVGGVPQGAAGQEGTLEADDKPKGKFTGIFSGALLKR